MEELKFIEDIRCEYSLMNYVQILSKLKDNCLIILVVKDTAGNCLTSEEVDAIKTLGFTNLNTKPQNMYCGVLYGGKVLCNECGKERWQPVDVTLSGQIYNYEIELSSMAWQHGNKAEVIINGTDYAVNIRGLNFVVYDTEKKALIDSVAFDYHTENRQCKHKQFNNDISGGNHKVTIRNSLIKITDIKKYLENIKNLDLDDYFIIIAIKDTLGEYLNNDIQDLLNKLGLNKTLIKKYQCGYIAVINNGQVVYEFLANNKIGVKCNFEIDSYNLDIHSLPFTAGNLANITIGTAQCAVNARGLNIVVFDKQNQYVIDSVCFDTHVNTYLATRKDCSAFESRVFKYKVNMTLSSQTELDLQNSLNGLKNTIDVNAVHSDIKYWQLYKNGNETELEARKRFFVGMDYVNPEIKIIQDCISVLFYYFDKICKENGLKYFMVGGSLIGAVRHAGKCVPWDDDIDVYMPRDDINKLLQIMESNDEFAANVYFGTMGQAYIRYLRFMFKGVNVPCFVDIFYMDYVENSSDITWNKHNELRREMIVQTASLEAKLASDNRLKRSVEIAKLIDNQIKKEQGILNPFGKGTSLIYGLDQNTFWCKNVYDYDDIFPTVTVPFVYGTCEIPAKVDMMLQRMYGDIYTLPNRMTGAHPSLKLTDEQKIETVRITTFYVNKILNQ